MDRFITSDMGGALFWGTDKKSKVPVLVAGFRSIDIGVMHLAASLRSCVHEDADYAGDKQQCMLDN